MVANISYKWYNKNDLFLTKGGNDRNIINQVMDKKEREDEIIKEETVNESKNVDEKTRLENLKKCHSMHESIIKDWSNMLLNNGQNIDPEKPMTYHSEDIQEYWMNQLNDSYIGQESKIDKMKMNYLFYFLSDMGIRISKRYNTELKWVGRFKSVESFQNKVINRISKGDFDRDVNDYNANKFIIDRAPVLDSDINSELARRRKENLKKLDKFEKYKSENISQENFIYEKASRKEYFKKMSEVLDALIDITPEYATEEKDRYLKQKEEIETQLKYTKIQPNDQLTLKDIRLKGEVFNYNHDETNITDFHVLLSDYSSRINNDLLHQTLINYVNTVLKESDLLKRYDISIEKQKTIQKENGYTDKTIVFNTIAGKNELKLQTSDQERRGNANHFSHKDKGSKNKDYFNLPPEIPVDLNDEEAIKQFRYYFYRKIPLFYEATTTNIGGRNCTRIDFLDPITSFKKVYEVPEDHKLANYIRLYTNVLYENEDILLGDERRKKARQLCIIIDEDDIEAYAHSKELKELKAYHEKRVAEREAKKEEIRKNRELKDVLKKGQDIFDPRDQDDDRTTEVKDYIEDNNAKNNGTNVNKPKKHEDDDPRWG